VVRVKDTIAPTIQGFFVLPGIIKPADLRMVNAYAFYQASDASGGGNCTLGVTSNEPVTGIGYGSTTPDWVVQDSHRFQLRAERGVFSLGRLYTVTVTCQDAALNSTARVKRVYVAR
jgi:hypothetical protein